ncbi:C-type lectin domain family 7 member A-like isoform X2 [Mytilus californianus]|uniref:C-type lectin domain family 7 member A-like isoform X2 n=1 Tax=Mytilus californianus TaxID=6549 RepID=UPI00224721B1|nr:C-type lectin domain family 7 member A-like isoform X2 [Mytilus californianus]
MKMYEDLIITTPDEHIYSEHTYDTVDVRNSLKIPVKWKTKRRVIVLLVFIFAFTTVFTALLIIKEKMSNTNDTTYNQQTTSPFPRGITRTQINDTDKSGVNCTTGWITTSGLRSCYLFSNDDDATDWKGAQSECHKLGGSLTDVETIIELNFLNDQLLIRSGYEYWIGGTDNGTEDRFRWEPSEQPFNVTNWGPGEPNNLGLNGYERRKDTDVEY